MWGIRQHRGHVLVVDDEPQIAPAIAFALSGEHEVTVADGATDALARIARGERYDVILCDVLMPTEKDTDLYSRLREIAPQEALRVVFITGRAYLPEVRRFLESVPNACLEKPFDPDALRSFVDRRVHRERCETCSEASPPSPVLVVDDDDAERVVIASVLRTEGYKVVCACDGAEALEALRTGRLPSLMLLDLMMPRTSGWQVLARMADDPRLSSLPVVVLTGFDAREGLPPGRQVLHKPVDAAVLLELTRSNARRRGSPLREHMHEWHGSGSRACRPERPQ
jgi:CheY-like chemotaxis protein